MTIEAIDTACKTANVEVIANCGVSGQASLATPCGVSPVRLNKDGKLPIPGSECS
jgi:hypothetical protein